ncbi:MAG: EAL domain-containing protein [Actinomycetia bacterium]|nr:EAL domain-containing protein [Actinomycetes bacterium]
MRSLDGRSRPKVRVGVLLAALTVVPVLGIGWLAIRQVTELAEAEADLASVEEATADLLRHAEAEAAIIDENYWTQALANLERYDIPADVVMVFLGLDLVGEIDQARSRADRTMADLNDIRAHDAQLQSARQALEDGVDATELYTELSQQLRGDIGIKANEALVAASELDHGVNLVQAIKVLEGATNLRTSLTDAVAAFFQTQIELTGQGAAPHIELIMARGIYDQEQSVLEHGIDSDSAAGAAWFDLANQEATSKLLTTIEARAVSTVTEGFSAAPIDGLSVEAIAELTAVFGEANDSTDQHLALIQAAAGDISTNVALIRQATDQTRLVVWGGSLTVIVLTLLSAVILTRSIGRPLRDLAASADALRSGGDTTDIAVRGPAEVQSAAAALNEAMAHLRQAEDQALALADGRLDDISLDLPAQSRLGLSLQSAVERLRDSMGQREQLRLRLAHEASHDGLTGVPNRGASIIHLSKALARAQRSRTLVAVLFVDLDDFKQVNDQFGHPTGDRLLQQIAHRLVEACRQGDLVGRLGGDEFLVVAEPVGGAREALELAERIRQTIAAPLVDEAVTIQSNASIGVAVGDGTLTADELIRDADLAVYQAKQRGRGRTELCNDELRTRMVEEADLEQAIRAAIADDDFELFHQPIVDARTGRPQSTEALVRWHRDGEGLVLPDRFIPLAEKSQLIIELDRWVLGCAARQLREWEADPVLGLLPMAVNISGRHLGEGNLLRDVTTVLQRWQVPARKLILEITESALLEDLTEAAVPLLALQSMGVRIAIDDFGTGYTSLAQLRNLPANILKIDRSFTASLDRPEDLSLVKLVIEAGHMLGLEVTAEGVETTEQAKALRDLGTDTLQGYLFGRPVPAPEVGPALAIFR